MVLLKSKTGIPIRRTFVRWLEENVPPEYWEKVWWVTPLTMILLVPVGSPILYGLEFLGLPGGARAIQALMLLTIIGGPVIGFIVLWSVKEANLEPHIRSRAIWLSRLAVPGPFLILLFLFWIVSIV